MARELKNSYLEGERQLKDYQLEQARQKSLENLKIYGLDVTNGVGNLNFISKMKNSLNLDLNYPYKLDKFDDYSMELFLALKDFQRNKGLPVTGVLDIETLIAFDKTYPYSFNDQEKARLLNYYQGKNDFISEKGKVVTESTKVEIAKSEANLVSDNLSIPKNEALLKAKNNLNLSGSVTEMQNQILIIQKQYKITEDGKINNEILEIITLKEYFLKENQNAVEQNALSKEYQEKTLETLAKYPLTSELNISLVAFNNNIMKPKLQTNPNFDQEYKEFYTKIESKAVEYTNSPEGQQNLKEAESNGATLYEVIKDPNTNMAEKVKAVATNPILLTGAGILFLFGSFGTGTKLTDAWWKRLLVILGLTTLGPDAIKGLALDKAYDDFGKNISSTSTGVNTGVDEGKTETRKEAHEATQKFVENIPNWVSEKYDQISKGVPESYNSGKEDGIKALNSINATLTGMSASNLSLRNSKNASEKEKSVSDENFLLFSRTLVSDKIFNSKEISELKSAKGDHSKIKLLLSDSTKNEIFPDNLTNEQLKQRNKELVNYVDLILEKEETNDVYISDIFIKEKGVASRTKETIVDKYNYFSDEDLNQEFKNLMSKYSGEDKGSLGYTLSTMIGSEDNGKKIKELDKFIKNSKIDSDKKILKEMKNIYLVKLNYDILVSELDKIGLDGKTSQITTIEANYRGKVESYMKDPINTSEIFKIFDRKVDEKLTEKRKNILQAKADKTDEDLKQLNSLDEKEKFDKNYSLIGKLPENTLEGYRKYLAKDRVLAYAEIIRNGDKLKFAENKVLEVKKQYEQMVKNIYEKSIQDIERINKFSAEVTDAKKDINYFNAKKEALEGEMDSLLKEFYPKETVSRNWFDILNKKENVSVYGELSTNLKVIANITDSNFKAVGALSEEKYSGLNLNEIEKNVMSALTSAANSFSNEKQKNTQDNIEQAFKKPISEIYEISEAYNKLRNNPDISEDLKKYLPEDNGNTTFEGLNNSIIRPFGVKLEEEKKAISKSYENYHSLNDTQKQSLNSQNKNLDKAIKAYKEIEKVLLNYKDKIEKQNNINN